MTEKPTPKPEPKIYHSCGNYLGSIECASSFHDRGLTCAYPGCDSPTDGRFEGNNLCQFHLEFCIDEKTFEHCEDYDPRRLP